MPFALAYWSISVYWSCSNSTRYLYSRYVISPQGVWRILSRWSLGVLISGVRFWNFTAWQPAATATSMSCLAMSTSPLWLMPISPMTYTGCPVPTSWSPIWTERSAGTVVAVVLVIGMSFRGAGRAVPAAREVPRAVSRAPSTRSQTSRTAPWPPGRSRTTRATAVTSGRASATATGQPTTSRAGRSLTSLPT